VVEDITKGLLLFLDKYEQEGERKRRQVDPLLSALFERSGNGSFIVVVRRYNAELDRHSS
jgi:hypothetical protein